MNSEKRRKILCTMTRSELTDLAKHLGLQKAGLYLTEEIIDWIVDSGMQIPDGPTASTRGSQGNRFRSNENSSFAKIGFGSWIRHVIYRYFTKALLVILSTSIVLFVGTIAFNYFKFISERATAGVLQRRSQATMDDIEDSVDKGDSEFKQRQYSNAARSYSLAMQRLDEVRKIHKRLVELDHPVSPDVVLRLEELHVVADVRLEATLFAQIVVTTH